MSLAQLALVYIFGQEVLGSNLPSLRLLQYLSAKRKKRYLQVTRHVKLRYEQHAISLP